MRKLMPMIFIKRFSQSLPVSLETIWQFLTDPHNLEVLTPPEMGMVTLSQHLQPIYPGQIITYHISPILNLKMSWVTEITQVRDLKYFVDEQRFGPYKFWHHQHLITEIDGGVELTDIIHYKMPLGFIGRMVHPFLVEPKLNDLFKYRKQQLILRFGEFPTR